jgi:hypothetical protein
LWPAMQLEVQLLAMHEARSVPCATTCADCRAGHLPASHAAIRGSRPSRCQCGVPAGGMVSSSTYEQLDSGGYRHLAAVFTTQFDRETIGPAFSSSMHNSSHTCLSHMCPTNPTKTKLPKRQTHRHLAAACSKCYHCNMQQQGDTVSSTGPQHALC